LSATAFRPPNWTQPQLWSLTTTLPSSAGGMGSPTTYWFDAVLRADHDQELAITRHPVQNGASITDHAYAEPAVVVLEVAVSDAMDSYSAGQYSGGSSKSVTAYQQFLQIQQLRLPCTLATRLNTYENVLVAGLRSYETKESVAAWRGSVRFQQIIMGTVAQQTVSARPNQTGTTNEGTLGPETPSDNFVDTFANPGGAQQPSYNSNPAQPLY